MQVFVGTLTEYAGDLAVFERVVQTNLTATVGDTPLSRP
jgi:hypothetical protein